MADNVMVLTDERITLIADPDDIPARRRALGERLAAFRQAAGVTQGQLARTAFCDRTTIAHTEKGRRPGLGTGRPTQGRVLA